MIEMVLPLGGPGSPQRGALAGRRPVLNKHRMVATRTTEWKNGVVMGKVQAISGHDMKVRPTESGRRWQLTCSCGYGFARWIGDTPPTCATEREAIKKGAYHLVKVDRQTAGRDRLNGVSATRSQRSA